VGSKNGAGRKPLMAGNWKMNLNHLEAIALVQKLAFSLSDADYQAVDVAVIPPFTALRSVQTLVDGDRLRIRYGAQDVSAHEAGAYTGEISASMLAKLGCTYVVVGHSERRQYHHEDDALVNAKVKAVLGAGMTPILCIGEPLHVRQADGHVGHCLSQLDGGLAGVPADKAASSVIAYEPVWAIGTGRTATPDDAAGVHRVIRRDLEARLGAKGAAVPILYGGSVNKGNAAALLAAPDVDGLLVGGASLEPDGWAAICAT